MVLPSLDGLRVKMRLGLVEQAAVLGRPDCILNP